MEIWFIAAVGGALFAGISNFYFKRAAVRGHDAELFSLYGGLISIAIALVTLSLFPSAISGYGWLPLIVFIGGCLAAFDGILKIYALRHIDSTIYFPLFKLLAPALAIVFGISFFGERFSFYEWFGLILGLLVPLLLITKNEQKRQNNLAAGLILVLVTGVLSAGIAAINKFAIDELVPTIITLLYASTGIVFGGALLMVYQVGIHKIFEKIKYNTSKDLIINSSMRAILIMASMALTLLAYAKGGTLAIVQTIHSMYILIPVVLAVVIYNEHWNTQKVVAIVLSVASLALLG